MKPLLRSLSVRTVRGVGASLLVAAVALPAGALVWRQQQIVVPDEIRESLRPAMVRLPGGTFSMGSPEDEEGRDDDEQLHEVSLSPFWVSRTEITQAQYESVVGANPREDCASGYQVEEGDRLPAVCVSWLDSIRYCNALSRAEGLEPAYEIEGESVRWDSSKPGYRLPTEAEWEYAARSGERARYVGTNDVSEVCRWGNVADQAAKAARSDMIVFECDDGARELEDVSGRLPNEFHLFGLGGNVSEWVWDWYGSYEGTATDPSGPETGSFRVIRGASWFDAPLSVRVAFRYRDVPSWRYTDLGFRIARSASP